MVIRDCALRPLQVLTANPATESREVATGAILANGTIFRHLKENGYDAQTLEGLIPPPGVVPHPLGIRLYGSPVLISHTGRILFEEEFLSQGREERIDEWTRREILPDEEECDHGFVVRDVEGDMRFLCQLCETRFPRHPSLMNKLDIKSAVRGVREALESFREGAQTLTSTLKETRLTMEGFSKAMEKMFPPQEIGSSKTIEADGSMQTSQVFAPKRTSCPAEIEALFGDPDVTLDDIQRILNQKQVFPDILQVHHRACPEQRKMIVTVDFVDDTSQRIEIDESLLMEVEGRNGKTHRFKIEKQSVMRGHTF